MSKPTVPSARRASYKDVKYSKGMIGERIVRMSEETFNSFLRDTMECGKDDGQIQEARESLKLKFTERELRQLVLNVWFSDVMDSIRYRIGELEKKVKKFEQKK